jgi:hypothetical protein
MNQRADGYSSAMTRMCVGRLILFLAWVAALDACGGGTSHPPGQPAITVSPDTLNFGSQRVGVASGSQQLTVVNVGGRAVTFSGVALSGAGATNFSAATGCGATLAVGASCSVAVSFAPTGAGALAASLTILANATTPAAVSLTGTGVVPALAISAATLQFSTMAIDRPSIAQVLTVSNPGVVPVTPTAILVSGMDAAAFLQANTCTTSLVPGATCAITVTFKPSSGGQKAATLTVQSDAPVSLSVALSGTLDPAAANVAALKTFLGGQMGIAGFATVSTTLASDLDASSVVLQVTSASGFPAGESYIAALMAGGVVEYVLVTGGMGTTDWSVIRGYNGSTPATFTGAGTTVTWVPLAMERASHVNGDPLTSLQVGFVASVGGMAGGILSAPVANGVYEFRFDSGETRTATVQFDTNVSWSPALAAGAVLAATSVVTLSPAGTASSDPRALLAQRFDQAAAVFVTQRQRLARRGAILTADVPPVGGATLSVDSVADFPATGEFVVSTGPEDMRASVRDQSTLNIVARAQNGTAASAINGTATTLNQLFEVDFLGGGGTQAFLVPGQIDSGARFLGVSATIGALKEYAPEQPLSIHFTLSGSYFEILTSGNVAMYAIADGVTQQAPNYLVEPHYGGRYWHKFDFGSAKLRHITLFAAAYPMAIAYGANETLLPWDRSADPLFSFDSDSFGQTEGYSWQSAPNGGGLGLYFESMLDLGITQFDLVQAVGGTGYSTSGTAHPPALPRPTASGVERVAAIAAGIAPSIFVGGLGHNDNAVARSQFASDTLTYWQALRAAWPTTVLVAGQFFFPAAGVDAPLAFEANPLSTPNDPAILAALKSVGGPWIFLDANHGTWQNSSGASGPAGSVGQPLLTGTGFGGAPGYGGGHGTGVGNGDLMVRDDGVHPSNLGARYLGGVTASAIRAGILAL